MLTRRTLLSTLSALVLAPLGKSRSDARMAYVAKLERMVNHYANCLCCEPGYGVWRFDGVISVDLESAGLICEDGVLKAVGDA